MTKQIKKLTKNNFWMIGKTKWLYQAEMLKIKDGSLYLFVTDGVTTLDLVEKSKMERLRIKKILNLPFSKIPEKLIEAQSYHGQIVDDASCMALVPPFFPVISGFVQKKST